jgi:hypothetical protein
MIVKDINAFVWANLQLDTDFSSLYDRYRAKYGDSFIPFFPVTDSLAGDASWGSECYVIYDPIYAPSTRQSQYREQIVYQLVGPLPQLFDFRDRILDQFKMFEQVSFSTGDHRITGVEAWQSGGTRVKDQLRQLYYIPLIVEVHFIKC